ncbi:MAG: 16S rRNA (adenine(1518)-N(6)/adenine(1519)-N(6))-dimethyltransferase RsmA [Patescibacteria group bacterium]
MKPAEILRELDKLPQKKFGQNFLTDEKVLADMVEAADIQPGETVVEIGSGLGVLTFELLKHAKQVIAIEADRDLADYLRDKKIKNLTVITGDALRVDWTVAIKEPYRIVANIPYSITSPLLRKIFALDPSAGGKPVKVVLLVQKELAVRITAPPGSRERGFLTLLCEASAKIKIVRTVKPGSFHPMPKVESAIIEVVPLAQSKMTTIFWPVIEAGFSHQRQTAVNAIANSLHLPKGKVEQALVEAGLDPMVRPAVLTFDQWKTVSKSLENLIKSL